MLIHLSERQSGPKYLYDFRKKNPKSEFFLHKNKNSEHFYSLGKGQWETGHSVLWGKVQFIIWETGPTILWKRFVLWESNHLSSGKRTTLYPLGFGPLILWENAIWILVSLLLSQLGLSFTDTYILSKGTIFVVKNHLT